MNVSFSVSHFKRTTTLISSLATNLQEQSTVSSSMKLCVIVFQDTQSTDLHCLWGAGLTTMPFNVLAHEHTGAPGAVRWSITRKQGVKQQREGVDGENTEA